MTYRERSAGPAGVVLWERPGTPAPQRSRILPDGCMDLVWDGRELIVAGPDTAARWYDSPAGRDYAGLRFHGGRGPLALGVPAARLRDQYVPLADVWPATDARRLAERAAADPAGALTAWAAAALARQPAPDPFGPRVLAMARAAVPAARMAERLGLSPRQLHRLCLPAFGYGPRLLARILRLGQALDAARSGLPLADVAAACGYADQAHLSREARALAGAPPGALLAAERD
jgi:AraC-like DNA-binding protein